MVVTRKSLELEFELEVLVFVEGGKPENPQKNSRSKKENQQKNSSHM